VASDGLLNTVQNSASSAAAARRLLEQVTAVAPSASGDASAPPHASARMRVCHPVDGESPPSFLRHSLQTFDISKESGRGGGVARRHNRAARPWVLLSFV